MNKLTIDEACAKYGFNKKRLIGFCARNDEYKDDPFIVDKNAAGEYLIFDDHRLHKLAKRLSDKANTVQP